MNNDNDWRKTALSNVRKLIKTADPSITEEIKWRKASNNMNGVPVWYKNGIICTGETYKNKVKLTFYKGASLPDPHGLFNGNDTGKTRRSIDIDEQLHLDEAAFIKLVNEAVKLNTK